MSEIALFCLVHPATAEKKQIVLQNLQHLARTYYRKPASLCTSWSYFAPAPQARWDGFAKASGSAHLLGGFEIYTDKSALGAQQKTKEFQEYHENARKQELYEKPEELVAWYRAAGYVSRNDVEDGGQGVLVMAAITTCKGGEEGTKEFVKGMGEYADWIKKHEPNTLTYSIFTRPKAPNEVLVFERFRNEEAFELHTKSEAAKRHFAKVKHLIQRMKAQEWVEVDESFVSHVPSGVRTGQASGANDNAKL